MEFCNDRCTLFLTISAIHYMVLVEHDTVRFFRLTVIVIHRLSFVRLTIPCL